MPIDRDDVVKTLMRQRAELIGYAWTVVGDPDIAEDVFQEVAVAVIRKCDEIQSGEHLIGWLYTAIRLEGLNARKRRQRDSQLMGVETLKLLEQTRSTLPSAEESDYMSALRECIKRVDGVARAVLELRYGQNLKPAVIAEQTGKKVQTVYKTITRAHSALRGCVRDRLSSREAQA